MQALSTRTCRNMLRVCSHRYAAPTSDNVKRLYYCACARAAVFDHEASSDSGDQNMMRLNSSKVMVCLSGVVAAASIIFLASSALTSVSAIACPPLMASHHSGQAQAACTSHYC